MADFYQKPWTYKWVKMPNLGCFKIFQLNTWSCRVFNGLSENHKIFKLNNQNSSCKLFGYVLTKSKLASLTCSGYRCLKIEVFVRAVFLAQFHHSEHDSLDIAIINNLTGTNLLNVKLVLDVQKDTLKYNTVKYALKHANNIITYVKSDFREPKLKMKTFKKALKSYTTFDKCLLYMLYIQAHT